MRSAISTHPRESRVLPAPNPDVVFAPLDGGAVLLHRAEDVYFGLNPVAARIWEMLSLGSQSLDSICGELQLMYKEVEPAVLRSDVRELLEELTELKLVAVADWPGHLELVDND